MSKVGPIQPQKPVTKVPRSERYQSPPETKVSTLTVPLVNQMEVSKAYEKYMSREKGRAVFKVLAPVLTVAGMLTGQVWLSAIGVGLGIGNAAQSITPEKAPAKYQLSKGTPISRKPGESHAEVEKRVGQEKEKREREPVVSDQKGKLQIRKPGEHPEKGTK